MGTRFKNEIDITLCVPQICTYVANLDEYKSNLDFIRKTINNLFDKNNEKLGIDKFTFHINTRDDYDTCELYLTAT